MRMKWCWILGNLLMVPIIPAFSQSQTGSYRWLIVQYSGDTLNDCTVDSVSRGVLNFKQRYTVRTQVPVDSVSVIIRGQEADFWDGAATGFLIGGILGGGFGLYVGIDNQDILEDGAIPVFVIGGAAVGALVGGGVGGLIGVMATADDKAYPAEYDTSIRESSLNSWIQRVR